MLDGEQPLPQAFRELADLLDTLPAATRDQPLPEEQEVVWRRLTPVASERPRRRAAAAEPNLNVEASVNALTAEMGRRPIHAADALVNE
jgi:hypothetical protein